MSEAQRDEPKMTAKELELALERAREPIEAGNPRGPAEKIAEQISATAAGTIKAWSENSTGS